MNLVEILSLLLACSIALNIAITTYLIARGAGLGATNAIFAAAGAAATGLGLYIAAVGA